MSRLWGPRHEVISVRDNSETLVNQVDTCRAFTLSMSVDPPMSYLRWEGCLHGDLLGGTCLNGIIGWLRQCGAQHALQLTDWVNEIKGDGDFIISIVDYDYCSGTQKSAEGRGPV